MKKPLSALILTQFLSSFTDSTIIFIIAFMIKRTIGTNDENNPYIFLVESFFLFAYILFAPFVGTFADRNSKSKVLLVGNATKALGILCLILGVNPAFCYGIIGIGAAIYGPAKYGILKELTKTEEELLDANGKLEGFTILSIIIGTVVGGSLSSHSQIGTIFCLVVYILSIVLALRIPVKPGNKELQYGHEAIAFFGDLKTAFKNSKLNFAYIGSGAFWMISVVIKNALLLWIPISLGLEKGFHVSLVVGMTAIGIVIGSLLSKKFTSIEKFYRAGNFGLVVAALAITFPLVGGPTIVLRILVCVLLLALGAFAGLYIIPLNATLQEEGHKTIGTGKTIAVQNFTDNAFMLFGTYSVYLLDKHYGFSVTASLIIFGFVYLAFVLYLILRSKKFKAL